jgi:hypothetical protein
LADKKISQLTALTGANTAADDVLAIVDTSANETKKITVSELLAYAGIGVGSFSWNSATNSPAASSVTSYPLVTEIHRNMRRCVLTDAGKVNYYLSATNSLKKEDGVTDAVLTGADGQVMVEIPAFYTRRTVNGTVTTWFVSSIPLSGFTIHPAFVKDGVEVPFRYYGAYDACYLDATDSTYKSGLNLDNLSASLDLAADKLSSVSGVYPIVGVLRSDTRSLAANRGTGWRQLDFALWSAVQMLYLVEYQSFFSQNILGAGNTNGSYVGSSSNQTDSPHTIAGASNSLGNASTNTTTGAGVSAKPGTSFMSYRGIENFYGNCWNWADGINVNVTSNGNVHVTNTTANFADNTSTNMTLISTTAPTSSNYVSNIASIDNYFVPSSVSGGSSTTYLTDFWSGSASSNRVVLVGGAANAGASAGAFDVGADIDSSDRYRSVGARLAF